MKKRFGLLFLALCLLMGQMAGAEVVVTPGSGSETIRIGDEVTQEEVCTFSIQSVKEYDVFMGVESGDAQQFLVVSFDLLNWQTEPFYVRTQTSAQLAYADDFTFESTYLWSNPGGTYQLEDRFFRVYSVDESGALFASVETLSMDFTDLIVRHLFAAVRRSWGYSPMEDQFIADERVMNSMDGSKTVLDPLVQRTYHYVFQVPEIVAEDEGLRVLTLTVNGTDYQMRF